MNLYAERHVDADGATNSFRAAFVRVRQPRLDSTRQLTRSEDSYGGEGNLPGTNVLLTVRG